MRASNKLIQALKIFEGCKLKSYVDCAGVLTIGYGHTLGVKPNQTITQEQADSLLKGDLLPAEKYVDSLGVCKTQGQFDALVDFVFNLGSGALRKSSLLKFIKQGQKDFIIQSEFGKWIYAGGKKQEGLIKRREWEAKRWVEK